MSFEFLIVGKDSCIPARPFGQTIYIARHRSLPDVNDY